MLVLAAENAPPRAKKTIGDYQTRKLDTFATMPFLLFAMLLSGLLYPTRPVWAVLFMAACLVVQGTLVVVEWVVPTRRYKRYLASGYIVEISNPAYNSFHRAALRAINRAASDERAKVATTILQFWQRQADPRELLAELTRLEKGFSNASNAG